MPSYVIVGASRGLGYEWLRQLSADPANIVVGIARTPGPVEAKLAADGIKNVHLICADMVDHVTLNAAAAATAKITPSIDYLIVNGAYQEDDLKWNTPTELIGKEEILRKDMQTSLEVNVIGVIFSINAFLPLVRKSAIKKIIAISTGLADTSIIPTGNMSWMVTYSAMKAALNNVVARYSVELKPEGIAVLALSPGFVNTAEAPPAAEVMPRVIAMMKEFGDTYPHFAGPASPEESVAAQRKVIEDFNIKDSGAFLSHHGNKEWI